MKEKQAQNQAPKFSCVIREKKEMDSNGRTLIQVHISFLLYVKQNIQDKWDLLQNTTKQNKTILSFGCRDFFSTVVLCSCLFFKPTKNNTFFE